MKNIRERSCFIYVYSISTALVEDVEYSLPRFRNFSYEP